MLIVKKNHQIVRLVTHFIDVSCVRKMLLQLVPKLYFAHYHTIICLLMPILSEHDFIPFGLCSAVNWSNHIILLLNLVAKKCYYFWRSPWPLTSYMMKSNKTWYYALFFCTFLRDLIVFKCWFIFMVYTTNKCHLSCALVSNSGPSTMHKSRWLVILSCIPWCSTQRLCRYKITSFRYDRDRN